MKWINQTKWIYLISVVFGVSCLTNAQKHKRQIYREQVLPALGGKIPEEAFRTDRLALNRLNKDGITVIDGVLLEAREHDKNPDNVRSKPEVIQVYVTQDSRYVPPEGRYHSDRPKSVDTTYVIRKPIGDHRDQTERTIMNGIVTLSTAQRDRNRPINTKTDGVTRNTKDDITGYRSHEASSNSQQKSLGIPSRGTSSPKAHGYANFHRFLPTISNNRLVQHQQQQQNYPTIYKPIVTPLVIPARDITFSKFNNDNYDNKYARYPSWDLTYDWNPFYQSSPQPLFLEDSGDLFLDSHQIITDYEGFFNDFHGRSYRHIGSSNKRIEGEDRFSKLSREKLAVKNIFSNDRARTSNNRNEKLVRPVSGKSLPTYTELTNVPETNFSCAGKKGTFADVETKCQVFHECSGWSKTSSLCPVGTAYSPSKKRCEWWNTVTCGIE